MTVKTSFQFSVSESCRNSMGGKKETLFISLAGKVCEHLMKNELKCCCRTELNTVKPYMLIPISMPGWMGFPK